MSWKVSRKYFQIGRLSLHVFSHALDPDEKLFIVAGIGLKRIQLWPRVPLKYYELQWLSPKMSHQRSPVQFKAFSVTSEKLASFILGRTDKNGR